MRARVEKVDVLGWNKSSNEQPIPLVDENRREYETILRCICAGGFLLGFHELPVLHGLR